ncbi:DNA-binding transcriptional LysR family regulator [Oikeobacillus pervagus]|uniref:DNA-binding transcriptional LysR family regulator n=1 Tax=Oikeobacillus pervagus TaxID=1325931 RepID=A0AAJ1T2P7_9BACI|nr:LysR family transcriptional regulator [Oikeobacillus pervagus]MDQ0215591.1 DNA-binding transcriptional LysR family regulator [Oikeobacillus pervagus]
MEQKLKVFLTVANHLNFSRAAEELYITQPAVSQYVKALEDELQIKLIERTNKTVRLTKAGSIVAFYSEEIEMLYQKMHQAIEDLTSEVAGDLSIGASYSFGEYILPHILAPFLATFPKVKPNISIGNTHDIVEKLMKHEIDLGIVEGSVSQSKVKLEKIATDTMYIIGGKGWKNQTDAETLEEEAWIVREKGSGTREAVELFFEKYNLKPKKLLEFGSTQIIKESVEAGLGISLLSKWTVRKEVELNRLQMIGKEQYYYNRDFFAVTSNYPFTTKAITTFLQFLRTFFEKTDQE